MKTSEIDKFVGHRVKLWKRHVTNCTILVGTIEKREEGGKATYVFFEGSKAAVNMFWAQYELSPSHISRIEMIE